MCSKIRTNVEQTEAGLKQITFFSSKIIKLYKTQNKSIIVKSMIAVKLRGAPSVPIIIIILLLQYFNSIIKYIPSV